MTSWLKMSAAVVAGLVLLAARGEAQTNASNLVVQGGTLIDATGRPPIDNAVIVIEGNRIKAVGRQGDIAIPAGSRIIDMKGKTLLPGYIDGHCHLLDFMGEIYLHLGITTCPDITTNDDEWTMAQRDGTALGRIRGPRIWSTGARLVGVPPPWARSTRGYVIKTPEDAVAAMRKKKADGLEIVKFNEYVPDEAVRAGAAEAKKLGLPVTCHCLNVFLAAESDFAGVEHHWAPGMTSIDDVKKRWEIHERRIKRELDTAETTYYYQAENFDKIVAAMVAHNVSWAPTIATWFRPLSPSAEKFRARELSIFDDPKASYLPPMLRQQTLQQYDRYARYNPERLEHSKEGYKKVQDLMVRFVKAGGTIRAGSDPNNGLPGLGLLEEMVLFTEAGLTPMQAIQAGTINVARAFRKDKDFGTVEPGKIADLVAIEGDPLKDIWAVQNVKAVIKDGELIDIEFHADHVNPIPNIRPWRAPPRDIRVSPRLIAQGAGPTTLKVTAATPFDNFQRVTFNGRTLETRFVSRNELEATVPADALKEAGTIAVTVYSPGDFAAKSAATYLIVSFQN